MILRSCRLLPRILVLSGCSALTVFMFFSPFGVLLCFFLLSASTFVCSHRKRTIFYKQQQDHQQRYTHPVCTCTLYALFFCCCCCRCCCCGIRGLCAAFTLHLHEANVESRPSRSQDILFGFASSSESRRIFFSFRSSSFVCVILCRDSALQCCNAARSGILYLMVRILNGYRCTWHARDRIHRTDDQSDLLTMIIGVILLYFVDFLAHAHINWKPARDPQPHDEQNNWRKHEKKDGI